MSKLRRKFIAVLAVLFCALLALSMALFIPKNKKVAEAASGDPIGEIYNDGYATNNKNAFSAANLRKLYAAITGNKNATYKTVEELVGNGDVTSAYIRKPDGTNNKVTGGNNVSVYFGDLKWDVVYLTTVRSDTDDTSIKNNIVIDLWLSSDQIEYDKPAVFSSHRSGNANVNSIAYPSSMYATSKIRVETLNAGGNYSTGSDSITNKGQSNEGRWARFTVTNPTNCDSLIEYIVQPKDISYQERLSSEGSHVPYLGQFPNDAYAKDMPNVKITGFQGKTEYDLWKTDYIWLPGFSETGGGDGYGLWKTDTAVRSTATANTVAWLRSGNISTASTVVGLGSNGEYCDNYSDTPLVVRPALHLNLTKAEKAAKGISFDNVKIENVDNADAEFPEGVDVHTFEHVYDGKTTAVTLLNKDDTKNNLTVGGDDFNYNYSESTGKGVFSATEPDTDKDKTYKITVTPNNGYVWDDNDGKEVRTYEITIKRAKITVDWGNIDSTVNKTLLQDNQKINLKGNQTPTVTYWIGTATPSGDFDYKPAGEINTTSTKTGKYYVYYKIEAPFHESITGSYTVDVKNGSLTVTVKGSGVLGSAQYAKPGSAFKPEQEGWLESEFVKIITLSTGTGSPYDNEAAVKQFLSDSGLKMYLYTDSLADAKLNGSNHYGVGTYYLGLKDTNNSYSIEWKDELHPSFTITPRDITVKVVPAEGADKKWIYGNDPVSMLYEYESEDLADGEQELTYEQTIKILGLGAFQTSDGKVLDDLTVGNYDIEGKRNDCNYAVTFEKSVFSVEPRPLTLQVAYEEIEYGKFDGYDFHEMTKTEDSLRPKSGDTIAKITENAEYYLTNEPEGEPIDSSNVPVGDYYLCATVTYENYVITVVAVKIKIVKGNFDMSAVKLNNAAYVYNGEAHPAQISGTLPDGVSVSYRYVNMADSSSSTDAPVELGLYLVYASFTHSNDNYNEISDKVAYIRIAATQEDADQPFPDLPSDEDLEATAQLAKKKAEAKKSLDDVAKAKKEEIAAMEISDDEKAKANSEIDKELAAGNAAIDSATDASGVEQAFNDGKKKIEDISAGCKAAEELAKKKKAAKDELEQAAKDKNAEIDNNTELTDEEKAEAKKKVESELAKGKADIDSATDASGVESAQSTSKANIENIKGIHKENSSFPWWIIIVVAGVLALLAVLIIVIVKRRQTADGDDEYDDFYDDEYDFDEDIEEDEDFGDEY